MLLLATSTASRVNRLPIKATSTTSTPIIYINLFIYKYIYVKIYVYNRAPRHASERFYRRACQYIGAHVNIEARTSIDWRGRQ